MHTIVMPLSLMLSNKEVSAQLLVFAVHKFPVFAIVRTVQAISPNGSLVVIRGWKTQRR